MGVIIDKIRSWFCKHEWECLSQIRIYNYANNDIPCGYKWVYVCKKCMRKKTIKS